MKWDYKTVVLTGGFMGRHKEELRRDHLEQQFDQLGGEGWDLAWVLMNQSLQGEKDGHVVMQVPADVRRGVATQMSQQREKHVPSSIRPGRESFSSGIS